MVYRYFIKKGKKRYGPYYYKSYREGGKVKKEYLGKEKRKKTYKHILIISAFLIIIAILFFFPRGVITGFATLNLEKNIFSAGEPIEGQLKLLLKEGEFLPAETIIKIELGNKTREISLGDLILVSGINIPQQGGSFYVENTNITGSGVGYGWVGKAVIKPEVFFKLRISKFAEENITIQNITETKNVTEITEENITEVLPEKTENITETAETEQFAENVTEEVKAEEEITEQKIIEEIVEEIGQKAEQETVETTAETEPSEEAGEVETSESQSESQTDKVSIGITGASIRITGSVVKQGNFFSRIGKFFGAKDVIDGKKSAVARITGRVIELVGDENLTEIKKKVEEKLEEKDVFLVEGFVTADASFIYQLDQQNAELVSGSVHTAEKNLDDNVLNLQVSKDAAKVTTSYTEQQEGFGQEYLGSIHEIEFNLTKFDLSLEQEGIYNLSIKLIFNDTVIVEEQQQLLISSNITNITVGYELIENEPDYDVTIDSIDYDNETQTLTVAFYHDSKKILPIYIKTEYNITLDYELSKNSSKAGEKVTLIVRNWSPEAPEQYFEIEVGKESEIVGFGVVPKYDINATVKDAAGQALNVTVEFEEPVNKKLKKQIKGVAAQEKVQKGKCNIKIKPEEGPVKEISINDVKINESIEQLIALDTNLSLADYVSAYAIDPTVMLGFTSANVTVIATGTELWKCEDWNFTEQSCYGEWIKLIDIVPGQNYSFILTPEDPGYAETLQPNATIGKDSYIRQNAATSNFGTSAVIEINRESGKVKRGIIEFDLSNIPLNAKITSALLQLYQTGGSAGTFNVEARRLTSSWTEDGVTWNSRDGTNNWGTAGGDFALTIYDSIAIGKEVDWITWDVTALVQELVNGSFANYGILLKEDAPDAAALKTFASSDNADSSIWPKLTINYTIPLNITFVSPTPSNGSTVNQNWVYVNISIENGNATEAKLEWAGNNYTMNNGTATPSANWFLNRTGLADGTYTYKAYANDSDTNVFDVSETRTVTVDTPPATVTNLANQSAGTTWIYWNWTNPADSDFNENIIYLDGVWQVNTSNNYHNATGLTADTWYTITINTKDTAGNVNITNVSSTAKTLIACTENWTAQYGSCLINDSQPKYYIDENECGTTNDLPADNGTYVACNYCSENITGPYYTACNTSDQQTKYYVDENYASCCAVTGLTSDCSIISNASYANQTLSCDYCQPNPQNTTWTAWQNQGSCLINDTQLQNRSKTEYDANYGTCYLVTGLPSDLWNFGNNNTYWEHREIECDYCTPNWYEVNTSCQPDDTIIGWYKDSNDCYAMTGMASDLEGRPANNTYWCDYIISTEFDGSTTNFSAVNLSNITNLVLEVPAYGKINFSETISINRSLDLDANIEISNNSIFLNSSALPELNKSAVLTLYNLTFVNPTILRNGFECSAEICTKLNYSSGTLVFNVGGFTSYSAAEGSYCGNGVCDPGEDYYSCPADCEKPGRSGWGRYVPPCVENWTCTAWSSCIAGLQTRNCTDTNNCGTKMEKPVEQRRCICVENWVCGNWTRCSIEEIQIRACKDINTCGTSINKPAEVQSCVYAKPSCSDGIQNQGELGIDCGGPCPPCALGKIVGKAIEVPAEYEVRSMWFAGAAIILAIFLIRIIMVDKKKLNKKKKMLVDIIHACLITAIIILIAILIF